MMHCQKLLILFLSSFLFSQTTINITEIASQLHKNQRINQKYLKFDSLINSKKERRFFLNHRKNSAPLSWFYLISAKHSWKAFIVELISSSECANEVKPASNALGARYTPFSSIDL